MSAVNEQQQLIRDTLERILTDLCSPDVVDRSENGIFAAELWQTLVQTGLTLAGLPEASGGAGGEPEDSLLVIREAAKFAAPLPLAEHFVAASLLADQGERVADEILTVAAGDFQVNASGKVKGSGHAAFARWCDRVLLLADAADGQTLLCSLPVSSLQLEQACNLAGEPRDMISLDMKPDDAAVFPVEEGSRDSLMHKMAAMRALQMAGALESVLVMSVQYSLERHQFGRPIAGFQAVQQQLATLAGEVAASTMAAHAVVAAYADMNLLDIAIGRARIGEAVSICTDIAHQVHGAMGYTLEHSLNHRTRRLWSWRDDDFGNERRWQLLVGEAFLAAGADNIWQKVTEQR